MNLKGIFYYMLMHVGTGWDRLSVDAVNSTFLDKLT